MNHFNCPSLNFLPFLGWSKFLILIGNGSQWQTANNFTSNSDNYSYSSARTENTTSNNNQLEVWTNGDIQQQHFDSLTNTVHRPTSPSSQLAVNRSDSGHVDAGNSGTTTITTTNTANNPLNQNVSHSNHHFASPLTASQSNVNNATNADNHRRPNNNNQPTILNNNHNDININSGTATRFRMKFQKLKKFFTQN